MNSMCRSAREWWWLDVLLLLLVSRVNRITYLWHIMRFRNQNRNLSGTSESMFCTLCIRHTENTACSAHERYDEDRFGFNVNARDGLNYMPEISVFALVTSMRLLFTLFFLALWIDMVCFLCLGTTFQTLRIKGTQKRRNYEFDVFMDKCPFWRSLTASTMSEKICLEIQFYVCINREAFFSVVKEEDTGTTATTQQLNAVGSDSFSSILAPQSSKANSQWITFFHIPFHCFRFLTESSCCLVIYISECKQSIMKFFWIFFCVLQQRYSSRCSGPDQLKSIVAFNTKVEWNK